MPKTSDPSKPRGRMSSYAYFVQTCRDEHKKKHPGEAVVFVEFSKKCAAKWKDMTAKEKERFEDLALKDKSRYEKEMSNYCPVGEVPGVPGSRKRNKKDPLAPKRALSAFFFFCNEERPKVKAIYPNYTIGEGAKELGKRWGHCGEKKRFEEMTEKDKIRYQKEMVVYKSGGSLAKKSRPAEKPVEPVKPPPVAEEEEEEDDDDDDDDDDDE